MKVEVKIDSDYKEPKVIVLTDKLTEEINELVQKISQKAPHVIAGFRNDVLKILEPQQIYRIYAHAGKVYAVTENEEFSLRSRLYELEERLDKQTFARISNSEIINLKKVKYFDLNLVGTIQVLFVDGSSTYVSRRYVSKIKQVLGV